jgi:hypothetical protein
MNTPITTLVKQRKSSKFPVNQEVTMKADGSGGPVSVTKKKDACYAKVKSRYKKWPSAYASGALVKCRKVGATNWGNSSPAKQTKPPGFTDKLYIKAEKLQDKAGAKAHKAAIAVDEGRDRKADRLYKRAAILEDRGIKIEERAAKRRKKI